MAAYTGRPGVDWGEVAQAVNVDAHLRAQEEARKIAAIRWQGQQDYQTLVGSGIDPAEALRRTAHKLYFGMSGTGMAAAVRARPDMENTTPRIVESSGIKFLAHPSGNFTPLPGNQEQPTPVTVNGQDFVRLGGTLHPVKKPDEKTVSVSIKPGEPMTVHQKMTKSDLAALEAANKADEVLKTMAPQQALFNSAKARVDAGHTGWFGGNLSDMLGSSNTLVQAGIDPNTAKMKTTPPSPSEMQGPTAPAMTPPIAATPEFTTASEVRAAYRAGKLSKEQAAKLLESQFQFGK